jgi:hypothetical protein
MEIVIETWRSVWRDGFAPGISTTALIALRDALQKDDPRVLQGATTSPPPIMVVQDWDVEAACPISYCGWIGESLETVGQVEEYFARSCFEADQRIGEPAGCRWFLNHVDDTPRPEMIRELLAEVQRELGNARHSTPGEYCRPNFPEPICSGLVSPSVLSPAVSPSRSI